MGNWNDFTEWEGSLLPDETRPCLMSSKPRLVSVNVCASEKQASLGSLGQSPGKLSAKTQHVSTLREFALLCLLPSPFGSHLFIQEANLTPRPWRFQHPGSTLQQRPGENSQQKRQVERVGGRKKGRRREREGGRSHKISTIYRTYDVTPIEYSLVKADSRRPEQQGAFGKSLLIYFYAFEIVRKSIIGCFK